jgi:hypothetical protein
MNTPFVSSPSLTCDETRMEKIDPTSLRLTQTLFEQKNRYQMSLITDFDEFV